MDIIVKNLLDLCVRVFVYFLFDNFCLLIKFILILKSYKNFNFLYNIKYMIKKIGGENVKKRNLIVVCDNGVDVMILYMFLVWLSIGICVMLNERKCGGN